MEVSRDEASSRATNFALRLLEARSFIHSTLSLEYKLADEPSEPWFIFCCLQVEVAEKEEAMKAAIAEVGTLQALLNTKRQDCTLSPSMERELV